METTYRPLQVTAGVQPPIDKTSFSTTHWTFADKINFRNGLPEKVGGWMTLAFDAGAMMVGVARNLFTDFINNKFYTVIGTHTNLYGILGSTLTDITPTMTAGLIDETASHGYGAGLYGAGLYGTDLVSSAGRLYPRIWFVDRYANSLIMSAGNQTGVYQWFGDTTVKPVLIANAPTAVNYSFVYNGAICVLGKNGLENNFTASDNTDITVWTSSSTNQFFDYSIPGAGRLTSHAPVDDSILLFTEFKTYRLRAIGGQFVYEVKPVDDAVGLIAPMARVSAQGIVYWMGQSNFYMYRGNGVEVIPANSQKESTILKYVFSNLNYGQKSKIFAWHNRNLNQLQFHYPSASSNEPDRIAKVNLNDMSWTMDTINRTAAEQPNSKLKNPRLVNMQTLYQHDNGTDADGVAMPFIVKTNKLFDSKETVVVQALIPDNMQVGAIQVRARGYQYPQSTVTTYDETYTLQDNEERFPMQIRGRFRDYSFKGNSLGQSWVMGQWFEEVQKGAGYR